MTEIVTEAITDIANDPDMSVTATFTPSGGDPVSCRVFIGSRKEDVGVFSHEPDGSGIIIKVQESQIGTIPDFGDEFTVDDTDYKVEQPGYRNGSFVDCLVTIKPGLG